MNGVEDVSVSGSGTGDEPVAVFLEGSSNATIEGSTDLYVLELVAGGGTTVSDQVYTRLGRALWKPQCPPTTAANPDTERGRGGPIHSTAPRP